MGGIDSEGAIGVHDLFVEDVAEAVTNGIDPPLVRRIWGRISGNHDDRLVAFHIRIAIRRLEPPIRDRR